MQIFATLLLAVYFTGGPLLILLNNRLLQTLGFPYPIGLSAIGVVFSAFSSQLLVRLKLVQTGPIQSFDFFLRSAVPIATLSALTLALGNAAYVHLSIATCQILKTLTPAITLIVLYTLRVEEPSARDIACVLLITVGTVGASRGELVVAPLGLLLQLGANLTEALRIVLSQRLISGLSGMSLVEMQYHVAPVQSVCLLVASLYVELWEPAARANALACVLANPLAFLGVGTLGLVLQAATLLVMRMAGSVALKLLGQARNAALVLFEVSRGKQQASAQQLMSYSISLAFFVAYVRMRQSPALGTLNPKRE